MKRLYILCPATISVVVALTFFVSCIFDWIGDKFNKTVWTCEEVPLGPFEVSQITVEFYSDGKVAIKLTGAEYAPEIPTVKTIRGTYSPDGDSAVLQKLTTTYDNYNITFIQANMSGHTLFLLWQVNDSVYPFTTAMRRVTGK